MDSTELRLILLGAGIILIIGIYAWEKGKRRRRSMRERLSALASRDRRSHKRKPARRASRRQAASARAGAVRREPLLEAGDTYGGGPPDRYEPMPEPESPQHVRPDVDQTVPEPPSDAAVDKASQVLPEVLVIHISARVGQRFSGDAIMSAARDVGLVPGQMEILHRFDEVSGEVLLSMASMVKPGTFPFHSMSDFYTPGLALFAQLPARRPSLEIYDTLLATGERLAALLNGRLQDERRRPLTGALRERMRERLTGPGTA
jgi:cell division protein ZipA